MHPTSNYNEFKKSVLDLSGAQSKQMYEHLKTSFEKKLFFCVGEYAKYGFDQQG